MVRFDHTIYPYSLGGTLVVLGRYPRAPSPDLAAVRLVLSAECAPESGLLVEHHEEMSSEKEEARVAQEQGRHVEESGAPKGERCTEVHGIAHESVGALSHQPARRIKGGWCAATDGGEGEDAPERDGRAESGDGSNETCPSRGL